MNFMLISLRHKTLAIEQEKNYSLASKQMAHDIRSPIFVLNSLASNTMNLPEDEKILIKNVSRRINEIANSFLHYNDKSQIINNKKSSVLPISTIIHSLIEEKLIECKFKNIELHYNISNDVQTTFIESNEQELYRAFSNIINNSIDASKNNNSIINITVNLCNRKIIISIEDNGIGIPEHILPHLFKQSYTYSKKNGKGLGLYYANNVIIDHDGSLELKSTVNIGTLVTITLNPTTTPNWFCEKIVLPLNYDILILDDCKAVQESWKIRLMSLGFKNKIFYATTISEFINFVEDNGSKNVFFIIDYDLNDKIYTGMELINRYQLQKCSVLSTGHSTDYEIISRCNLLDIKMLPKNYAHHVKIVYECHNNKSPDFNIYEQS